MNDIDITEDEYIDLCISIELARRHFYDFCVALIPDFYKPERTYLKRICDELEDFVNDPDCRILILNMPPRHGKTLTCDLLSLYLIARDHLMSVMKASYNTILSNESSKKVRDYILEEKEDIRKITLKDIFPDTRIKKGDGQLKMWSVEGAKVKSYISTSPKGTATGYGCKVMILDDIIKNHEEALRLDILEKHELWYKNTMQSRKESGGTGSKRIIIQTRWNKADLSGVIIRDCERIGIKYKHICLPLEQEDGTLLCESVFGWEDYRETKETMLEEIFQANYNQRPIDLKGRLYTKLKTYYVERKDAWGKVIPILNKKGEEMTMWDKKLTQEEFNNFEKVFITIDTADEGKDYLAAIVFGVLKGKIFVLDMLYTQAAMEFTEPQVVELIHKYKPSYVQIESNNGGRGFYRNVRRMYEEKYKFSSDKVKDYSKLDYDEQDRQMAKFDNFYIEWDAFTQTKPKMSRILGESTNVMRCVYFPLGWSEKWPDAFESISTYQKDAKNLHDDIEDSLTMTYELAYTLGYCE